MNFTKKDLINKITKESSVSSIEGTQILESFLFLVKSNAKLKIVKLSGFGSFAFKKTRERIGRNPKTNDSYIIPIMKKLTFKPSNKIKGSIN